MVSKSTGAATTGKGKLALRTTDDARKHVGKVQFDDAVTWLNPNAKGNPEPGSYVVVANARPTVALVKLTIAKGTVWHRDMLYTDSITGRTDLWGNWLVTCYNIVTRKPARKPASQPASKPATATATATATEDAAK
jgi:hypothetical protein